MSNANSGGASSSSMPDSKLSTSSSSSSSYTQQTQNSGSLYSFSVHQPYTNWPLHASHSAPYTPSWYTPSTQHQHQHQHQQQHQLQQHQFGIGLHKTYREQGAQTLADEDAEDERARLKGKEKNWDTALVVFLKRIGFRETLAGLKEDMVLLNEEWERERVPGALREFVREVSEVLVPDNPTLLQANASLDERKLSHVESQRGIEVQTPSSTIKSVSSLLRRSRRRNDASNRAEFLQSVAEKRRRLNELGEAQSVPVAELNVGSSASNRDALAGTTSVPAGMDVDADPSKVNNPNVSIPSCARADAKSQDRESQMKYDIAKNEDGPLRRTMKQVQGDSSAVLNTSTTQSDVERYPALAERVGNIETHLAVRFVPSYPRYLADRLKLLEDYMVQLEKEFPSWAALHFNQPNRGWPPPPRLAPIIVPSTMPITHSSSPTAASDATGVAAASISTASSAQSFSTSTAQHQNQKRATSGLGQQTSFSSGSNLKLPGGSRAKSSLHRAVMDKLEIRRAMGDLAAGGGTAALGGAGAKPG